MLTKYYSSVNSVYIVWESECLLHVNATDALKGIVWSLKLVFILLNGNIVEKHEQGLELMISISY